MKTEKHCIVSVYHTLIILLIIELILVNMSDFKTSFPRILRSKGRVHLHTFLLLLLTL